MPWPPLVPSPPLRKRWNSDLNALACNRSIRRSVLPAGRLFSILPESGKKRYVPRPRGVWGRSPNEKSRPKVRLFRGGARGGEQPFPSPTRKCPHHESAGISNLYKILFYSKQNMFQGALKAVGSISDGSQWKPAPPLCRIKAMAFLPDPARTLPSQRRQWAVFSTAVSGNRHRLSVESR